MCCLYSCQQWDIARHKKKNSVIYLAIHVTEKKFCIYSAWVLVRGCLKLRCPKSRHYALDDKQLQSSAVFWWLGDANRLDPVRNLGISLQWCVWAECGYVVKIPYDISTRSWGSGRWFWKLTFLALFLKKKKKPSILLLFWKSNVTPPLGRSVCFCLFMTLGTKPRAWLAHDQQAHLSKTRRLFIKQKSNAYGMKIE